MIKKTINEKSSTETTHEELEYRTEELLKRTLSLKQKIISDIEIAKKLYQKEQNENR